MEETTGAGVEGGFEEAGAAFGCERVRDLLAAESMRAYLSDHTHDESLLLNLV